MKGILTDAPVGDGGRGGGMCKAFLPRVLCRCIKVVSAYPRDVCFCLYS